MDSRVSSYVLTQVNTLRKEHQLSNRGMAVLSTIHFCVQQARHDDIDCDIIDVASAQLNTYLSLLRDSSLSFLEDIFV